MRARARAGADARAELLLVENLSPPQRLEYAANQSFVVTGRHGRFCIRRGGAVDLVGPNGDRLPLCVRPRVRVPDADTMLAQKLMLDANEDGFLRIAIPPHPPNRRDR